MRSKFERLEFYKLGNVPASIETKEGFRYEGYITELYEDYVSITDRVAGKVDIFLVDIVKLGYFKGYLEQKTEVSSTGNEGAEVSSTGNEGVYVAKIDLPLKIFPVEKKYKI